MQNNIGEARRSYGLSIGMEITQDMAAKIFNVSPSGYKKWEQGVGKLNGEILCNIADKYNTSVDYLLCRTDDPTPYPGTKRFSKPLNLRELGLLEAFDAADEDGKLAIEASAYAIAARFDKKDSEAVEGQTA